MDTDMDAPLPDELEWLENATTSFDEPPFEDEDEELLELCRAPPVEDSDQRKRHRVEDDADWDGEIGDERVAVEKKSKKSGGFDGDVEVDEGWLQYSPREEVKADCVVEEVVVEEKIMSRFASEIDGDCVAVTGHDGDRVYVKVSSGLGGSDSTDRRVEKPSKGLLSESIDMLMERLDDQAIQKALQESFGSPSHASDSANAPMVSERLWVEKYAPSSFLELLSDEQTNREVLAWLKQWDSFVFGSQIRTTTDDVLSSLRRHSSFVQHQRNFDTKVFGKNKRVSMNNQTLEQSNTTENGSERRKEVFEPNKKPDISSPPEHKILLLCGPPGLGKTTLAHVAAKHCGYRVVEINASDERSSSTIESKILDVVQMNSVMADSKPKCLVIDEIDGALGEGKGAVEVILKMIAGEKKSHNEKKHLESSELKTQQKRRRKSTTLSRPVICICNDLYSPALRPLRQIAKIHTFVQPTVSRVVNRLKFICRKEGFKTSSLALSALAECTECDIRSCLNTLQFLNKKKETLNILGIDSQVVGRKDVSRTAFDVWKEIMQRRKQKQVKSRNFEGSSGDFQFLYNLISNRGEYELTMDGIFENFLQLSYHDPAMHKTVGCLDMLGISDSLNRFIMRTQQMSLYVYQPLVPICARNLVAQFDRPNIEWPKFFQRCRSSIIEKHDLFKCWHNTLSPSISRHLSTESFVEDVVSPLLHILSPPTLRPVALHLLSEREKNDLSQLVDTMVSCSLTYRNSRPEQMTHVERYGAISNVDLLTLDPPINNFIKFKDYQGDYHGLSSSVKQILVHEVEKHKILSGGMGRCLDINDESNKSLASSRAAASSVSDTMYPLSASDKVKNGLEKHKSSPNSNPVSSGLDAKAKASGKSGKTTRHPSSFFDRFRKKSNDAENPGSSFLKSATTERDMRPFLFKYNEGFTNAIKRPVRMRELLQ